MRKGIVYQFLIWNCYESKQKQLRKSRPKTIMQRQKTTIFDPDNADDQQHLIRQLTVSEHLRKSIMNSNTLRAKAKAADVVDPVKVHVLKLQDIPDPLSKREFKEICIQRGIPIQAVEPPVKGNEMFEFSKNLLRKREQQKWQNKISSLFGAYIDMYELFKQWHNGILQSRHVAPEAPSTKFAKSQLQKAKTTETTLSKTERDSLERQRDLVSLLIKYGFGISAKDQATFQMLNKAGKQKQQNGGAYTTRNLSPPRNMFGQISNHMSIAQDNHRSSLQNEQPRMHANNSVDSLLELPASAKKIPARNVHKRRVSFTVSERGSRFTSAANSSNSDNSVQVEMDIVVRNNKDFEYFNYDDDQEDEIKLAKRASERLRLLSDCSGSRRNGAGYRAKTSAANHNFGNDEVDDMIHDAAGPTQEFFGPVQEKLRKELHKTREKLQEVTQQLENTKKSNMQILSKYTQEMTKRTVESKTANSSQADMVHHMESQFFNVADGLEPHLKEILDGKINQVKELFLNQIKSIQHHADSERERINLLEKFNKDGLSYQEMNTELLIENIASIESLKRDQDAKLCKIDSSYKNKNDKNRPFVVWQMLQKNFGSDYFLEAIEEEYGTAPGASEKFAHELKVHFEANIEKLKMEHIQIEQHYTEQITTLQEEIQTLVQEKTYHINKERGAQEILKQQIQKQQKFKFEEEIKAIEKRYSKSLRLAKERNEQLSNDLKLYGNSHRGLQNNYAFKRWQLFGLMKSVITNIDQHQRTGIDEKMLALAEKFIREEYLILNYSHEHNVPSPLARDEMHLSEKLELTMKIKELEHDLIMKQNEIDELKQNIAVYQSEFSALHNANTEERRLMPALLIQNKMLEQNLQDRNDEFAAIVIERDEIENRWKNNAKEPHKITTKKILKYLRLKSMNEFLENQYRMAKSLGSVRRNKISVKTTTDINGLNIDLVKRKPFQEKMIETNRVTTIDCQVQYEDLYFRDDQSVQVNMLDVPDLSFAGLNSGKRTNELRFQLDTSKNDFHNSQNATMRNSQDRANILRRSMSKSQSIQLAPLKQKEIQLGGAYKRETNPNKSSIKRKLIRSNTSFPNKTDPRQNMYSTDKNDKSSDLRKTFGHKMLKSIESDGSPSAGEHQNTKRHGRQSKDGKTAGMLDNLQAPSSAAAANLSNKLEKHNSTNQKLKLKAHLTPNQNVSAYTVADTKSNIQKRISNPAKQQNKLDPSAMKKQKSKSPAALEVSTRNQKLQNTTTLSHQARNKNVTAGSKQQMYLKAPSSRQIMIRGHNQANRSPRSRDQKDQLNTYSVNQSGIKKAVSKKESLPQYGALLDVKRQNSAARKKSKKSTKANLSTTRNMPKDNRSGFDNSNKSRNEMDQLQQTYSMQVGKIGKPLIESNSVAVVNKDDMYALSQLSQADNNQLGQVEYTDNDSRSPLSKPQIVYSFNEQDQGISASNMQVAGKNIRHFQTAIKNQELGITNIQIDPSATTTQLQDQTSIIQLTHSQLKTSPNVRTPNHDKSANNLNSNNRQKKQEQSAQDRPTTIRDTSKENSFSSSHNEHQFEHLQKYTGTKKTNRDASISDNNDDLINSSGSDIDEEYEQRYQEQHLSAQKQAAQRSDGSGGRPQQQHLQDENFDKHFYGSRDANRRLTRVQEQSTEFGARSSVVSSAQAKNEQSNNRNRSNNDNSFMNDFDPQNNARESRRQPADEAHIIDFKGSNQQLVTQSSKSRKNKKKDRNQSQKHGQEGYKRQDTFNTSDDSSSYEGKLKSKRHTSKSVKAMIIDRDTGPSMQGARGDDWLKEENGADDKQQVEVRRSKAKKDASKRNKMIQKLFTDGLIDDEQFLCLQLLKFGYMPAWQQANHNQANQNQPSTHGRRAGSMPPSNDPQQNLKNLRRSIQQTRNRNRDVSQKSGRMSNRSRRGNNFEESASPNMSPYTKNVENFIQQTYRYYPNKMSILEKILSSGAFEDKQQQKSHRNLEPQSQYDQAPHQTQSQQYLKPHVQHPNKSQDNDTTTSRNEFFAQNTKALHKKLLKKAAKVLTETETQPLRQKRENYSRQRLYFGSHNTQSSHQQLLSPGTLSTGNQRSDRFQAVGQGIPMHGPHDPMQQRRSADHLLIEPQDNQSSHMQTISLKVTKDGNDQAQQQQRAKKTKKMLKLNKPGAGLTRNLGSSTAMNSNQPAYLSTRKLLPLYTPPEHISGALTAITQQASMRPSHNLINAQSLNHQLNNINTVQNQKQMFVASGRKTTQAHASQELLGQQQQQSRQQVTYDEE